MKRSFIIGRYVILSIGLLALTRMDHAWAQGRYVSVRGTLVSAYDDNVTISHTNRKEDFLQSIGLGLDLKVIQDRNRLIASVDVLENLYFENSSFNNAIINFRVTDAFEISQRLRLNASEEYRSSEEPRSFDDEFGRTNGRYRTDKNNIDLGLDFDVNSHTLAQLTYGHDYTGYSRQSLVDTDMHRTGGRVQYELDDANRFGGGYDYSRRYYETGNVMQGHTIYADYGHHFTKQLSLKVKIGQDFIDTETTGKANQARYEVNLQNDIDEVTAAGIKYQRGLSSYAYSQDLFDSYRLSATLGRELTSRISVSGGGFFGKGEYKQSRIRDRLAGAGIGFTYALMPQTNIGINYQFSQTDSNQDTRSYRRNVVSLSTRVKF